MAGFCCEVGGETETQSTVESGGGRQKRRGRMEIRHLKFLAAAAPDVMVPVPAPGCSTKRMKVESRETIESGVGDKDLSTPLACENGVRMCDMKRKNAICRGSSSQMKCLNICESSSETVREKDESRFGFAVVRGRRRDMEDAVAVKPFFSKPASQSCDDLHFYGVYDGHGCSHVAMKCKDRMHEIVQDEVEKSQQSVQWEETMIQSFSRMDKEVTEWSNYDASSSNCRCELRTPQCNAVGSTAVVAVVTPDKIVVSNSGDSRAVLSRNGVAVPLSSDHKPDRPDELARIENAGGRVIYWDGARVLGVLAMSRSIGDNYLKPYVIPEPEVTVTKRTAEDEVLILASDGLWDVVSNDQASKVARMCLRSHKPPSPPQSPGNDVNVGKSSDKPCRDASRLLVKLALARGSTDNVSVVVIDLRRRNL